MSMPLIGGTERKGRRGGRKVRRNVMKTERDEDGA